MTALSFFANIASQKLGDVGDSMVAWYAQHDPATASEADITDLGQRADKLAHRIAEIQGTLEHDQHTFDGLNLKLTRDKQAAGVLGDRMQTAQAAGNAPLVTQFKAQLTAVLTEIEQLAGSDGTGTANGQLFDAQQAITSDQDDLNQFRTAHTQAVNDWTTARTRLNQARSAMEHAAHEKEVAQAQQQQAQRDAGLLHGSSPGHTALDAMEAQAERAKTEARAAHIQTDALRHTAGADVSSIVNSALTEAQPDDSSDVMARLARLTGKVA